MRWRPAVVSALAYSFCEEAAAGHRDMGAPYNDVARFVAREEAAMPDHLRLGVRRATLAFDLASIPREGRRFHRLPQDRRIARLNRWRRSCFSACRDFIRFYQALSIYALYSRLDPVLSRETAP